MFKAGDFAILDNTEYVRIIECPSKYDPSLVNVDIGGYMKVDVVPDRLAQIRSDEDRDA